jgi:hypothetical protein
VSQAGDRSGMLVRLQQVAVKDKHAMVFYPDYMSRLEHLGAQQLKSQCS